MAEKLGIEGCRAVVKAVGKCGTVVCKFINKEGLFTLIGLQEPVAVLLATNWQAAYAEMKDLSKEERAILEKDLSDSFQPPFPTIDAGLDAFLDIGERTAAVIEKGVADGRELVEDVKILVGEWKAFLGVK